MRNPLYELLAFKVLSLGVLRHERTRHLGVSKRTIVPSKYCRMLVMVRVDGKCHAST